METVDEEALIREIAEDFSALNEKLWEGHGEPPPSTLFHYTSTGAFVGIGSSKKLFLTDMLASTDQSELHYGVDVAIEALGGLPRDAFIDNLEAYLKNTKTLGYGILIYEYAVCFCEGDDVLTQWRGFAAGAGVAIGFDFGELYSRSRAGEFALTKMLYRKDEQLRIATEIAKRGQYWFGNIPPKLHSKKTADKFMLQVAKAMLVSILLFKHEAFSSEQEWRVFRLSNAKDRAGKVNFSLRSGAIIPYLEMDLRETSIKTIRCSPGHWSKSALHGVRELAATFGPDIAVDRSKLPL